MRFPAIVATTAILLAACGGEKKTDTTTTATTPPPAAAGDSTPAGAGHEIQMVQEGTAQVFKFIPENTTIKAGESVTFKSVSGQMHDVAFYPDSLNPAQAAFLKAAITDPMGDFQTQMTPEGSSVTISFANAPAGVYKFYCLPHQAMGMKGTITVQ